MGITGSLHCAGMCSPLVMAATAKGGNMTLRLVYNLGRIFTYGLMGLAAGAVGSLIPFDGVRSGVSLALGVVLIFAAVFGLKQLHIPFAQQYIARVVLWFKGTFAHVLNRRSGTSRFLLGMVNGILPCGLSFSALMIALTTGVWNSAGFMILFGIGTLPVMVGLASGLPILAKRLNVPVARIATVMLFVSGCILIARGYTNPVHQQHTGHQRELVDVVICK